MSAHLSDLNRAALAKPESYAWITTLALAYCVALGAYSANAWITDGEFGRAVLCAGAQGFAVVLGLLARRAFTGQMGWIGALCVLFMVGFASWAAEGIRHAWESNGARMEDWQLWFLASSEPMVFLLAEHVKEGREALRAAYRRDEEETRTALAEIRSRDARGNGERSHSGLGRAVSDGLKVVGGTATILLPSGANAMEHAPIVSTDVGYQSAREHALALWIADRALTQEKIAKRVGKPRSTVGKWIRDEQARLAKQPQSAQALA